MGIYKFLRISRPASFQVPEQEIGQTYRKVRRSTFVGVTAGYSLYYVCRMSLSVVKQPLIDGDVLTAGELGLIGSGLLLIYAFGKFINGFIADYCNIRRFMGTGLLLSSVINLIIAILGISTEYISTVRSSSRPCFFGELTDGSSPWALLPES